MTAFAYREVVAAEGAFSVMATHAAKRTSRCVMIERLRCGNVIRSHSMTVIATHAFVAIMLRVAETDSESAGCLSRAYVTTELVTHAAG